jgi:predicted nucleic acid-binding protein
MSKFFVDTNIFIRYLTNDEPEKADRVERLLQRTIEGKAALITNLLVIAELVWTLESYYGLPASEVGEKLTLILNTPNLEVPERQRILKALALYVEKNIDFVDAYNSFFAKDHGITDVLTYNKKHFKRVEWLKRVEP